MFGIIQNYEEEQGFWVDRRVQDGVPVIEKVYGIAPSTHSSQYREEFILYLFVSPTTVSAMLIKEEEKV